MAKLLVDVRHAAKWSVIPTDRQPNSFNGTDILWFPVDVNATGNAFNYAHR